MYLSKIHLCNWRSYGDAEFVFEKPSSRRPLFLIGAMNGHGKTSFLFSLYVGLFGRFGLRHVEGFQTFSGEETPHYREAIRRFRRSNAPTDEPTSIEIIFSPTADEKNVPEIRVVRRWFFTSTGQPRQGDGFEAVELFLDEKPQKLHTGLDAAFTRLERYLFRADVMPAFFFDGEQAQTLINNSGQDGMKKAVEVLFGTKVVEEALDNVKQFVSSSHAKLGGKRNADTQQSQLSERLKAREAIEAEIDENTNLIRDLEVNREKLENEQRHSQEMLSKLGGERKADLVQVHADVEKAEIEKKNSERALTDAARKIGLSLAVSRLAPSITNRLQAEEAREQWENLRDGTVKRTAEVLDLAAPAPPNEDTLLNSLTNDVRIRVRQRFQSAIEHIYNPPPTDCASEFILGHVRGESRNRLLLLLGQAKGQSTNDIRVKGKRLVDAKQQLEDAIWRRDRIGNLPEEVEKLSETLAELSEQISENSRKIGGAENALKSLKGTLKDLSAEIGRLQEVLSKLGPEQKRIAVAERVRAALNALNDQLKPLTISRLQECVTAHFIKIADRRYKNGKIIFVDSGSPILRRPDHPDALIEMMSGFERRAFGIAFSLALAEITKKRVPLVIDTPLGNADQKYRKRLLSLLTAVDLDQIIILTHDAEVTGPIFEEIEAHVKQTFLVEYDTKTQESVVYPGAYFEGIGR